MSPGPTATGRRARGRSRRAAAVVAVIGILGTSFGAWWINRDVTRDRQDRFEAAAEDARLAFANVLDADITVLRQLRNDLLVHPGLDRATFERLASLAFDDEALSGVSAIEWSPAITSDDADAYEDAVRNDRSVRRVGYPEFSITPPSDADVHHVLDYIVPYEGNEAAHGFDLATVPERLAEVEATRDRGDLVASTPLRLVQETGDEVGIVIAFGIYDTAKVPPTVAERRRHFLGTVRMVFRVRDLATDALRPDRELDLAGFDVGPAAAEPDTRPSESQRLFDTAGPAEADVFDRPYRDLVVGDRRWRLFLAPTVNFDHGPTAVPIAAAILGLLVTGLLVSLLRSSDRARDRAEELAASMTHDLRGAQERQRALLQHAPDATLVVGADGTIRLASERVRVLFGYTPAELAGRNVDTLLPVGLREGHVAHRASFVENPRPRNMGSGLQLEALRGDGSTVPVEISLATVGTGPDLEIIASVRDVTVRREAEEALRAALDRETRASEQLRETDRLRANFLETVSHELRTPLAAIVGFTDLVLRLGDKFDSEQSTDFVRRIDRNAQALSRLIEEILDFSRLERDAIAPVLEPHLLGEVVRSVVDTLETVLATHPVALDLDEAVTAPADAALLSRALTNLLTNAARYSPEGSTIAIGVRRGDGHASLTVADQGPGVSADERGLIFERFYRGRAARQNNIAGTGIGLAVVRELIVLMGGNVDVAEVEPHGARFEIRLPLQEFDVPETEIPPAERGG